MTRFLPNQIVCLTHESVYLYAEIIQHVTDRACCWARPLAIAQAIDPDANPQDIGGVGWTWQDLRETSDLLLPDRLFRSALDTEVLPLMARLYQAEDKPQERCASAQAAAPSIYSPVVPGLSGIFCQKWTLGDLRSHVFEIDRLARFPIDNPIAHTHGLPQGLLAQDGVS
jgi:hypothetical protein